MATQYQIISEAGVDLGTYEGETPEDALDAMARDAGYADQAAAAEVAGEFRGRVVACEWHCECGDCDGDCACEWSGPYTETVLVEYMPEYLRASHVAAGNRGQYPHNGAIRRRVERSCADRLMQYDGDWCHVVEES